MGNAFFGAYTWISVRIHNFPVFLHGWWWKKDIAFQRAIDKKCAELIKLRKTLFKAEIQALQDITTLGVPELLQRRREIQLNIDRIDRIGVGHMKSEIAKETIIKERAAFAESLSETNARLMAMATFLEMGQVTLRREIIDENFQGELAQAIVELSGNPEKKKQEANVVNFKQRDDE